MSHFTVLVTGDDVEAALAPFDEQLETERYVEATREQIIAKARAEIEAYRTGPEMTAYTADPAKYLAECTNPRHIQYLQTGFPEKLTWTDEQLYANETQWYEASELGPDGEVYSERNPRSKWDWWSVGGRWGGIIVLNDQDTEGVDTALAGEINWEATPSTFAILHDGEWYERGEMGWFGTSSGDKQENVWAREAGGVIRSLSPDTRVTLVDCHI